MKKLFCLLLALMLLCGGALAENSGLRERRAPAEDAATADEPTTFSGLFGELESAVTEADGATAGMVTDPKLVDIANMDDVQLSELGSRISRELDRRAMEAAGVSLGEGTVVVDTNDVRMTLYEDTVQYADGALRIDAMVENGSDRDLSLDVVLAEINGMSVLGYGVYNVYAGETVTDYIIFDAEGDEEVAAALSAPESLRFTIWAYDNDTQETYFTADVTL